MPDAVAAYKEVIKRKPKDRRQPDRRGGRALLRLGQLDAARQHAELAVSVAPAGAHEMLAKIALAARDRDGGAARSGARAAGRPTLPMPFYVEGLLLYHEGRYPEALGPLLRRAKDMLQAGARCR